MVVILPYEWVVNQRQEVAFEYFVGVVLLLEFMEILVHCGHLHIDLLAKQRQRLKAH
jgi:hypothetical protein